MGQIPQDSDLFVIFSTADGERIAQSTPIETLLSDAFQLKINDNVYSVNPPHAGE